MEPLAPFMRYPSAEEADVDFLLMRWEDGFLVDNNIKLHLFVQVSLYLYEKTGQKPFHNDQWSLEHLLEAYWRQ